MSKEDSQRAKRIRKQIKREQKAGNRSRVEKLKGDLEWELRIISSVRAAQKEEAEREAKLRAARHASPKIFGGGATGLRQQKRK
ncbi:MAG: hypothetical protein M3P49_11215 [Actinomycetota bacterium]|nr:hypothetical protein [Actinomycetota bacterium]